MLLTEDLTKLSAHIESTSDFKQSSSKHDQTLKYPKPTESTTRRRSLIKPEEDIFFFFKTSGGSFTSPNYSATKTGQWCSGSTAKCSIHRLHFKSSPIKKAVSPQVAISSSLIHPPKLFCLIMLNFMK